ncbi:glycosyltransferase family 4 protein [Pseudoalteromonas arctica]|uniref:glycosyltransferase family 4 protein n=1 Tax=Pseudoalteromonas arctica TaxID=394751 RepID=UPI001C9CF106|nr:glycosyltransferase family 4 protein [Pseudoalteromonas arctica]MBZ2192811.1 glycosyltransferase family 4 protein [Pseudoalteromonas arctica]
MKKTIIFNANTSWYLFNFRASTIKALQEQGYLIVCVSPEDEYSYRITHELGCIWEPVSLDNNGSNPLRDLGFMLQLIKIYNKYKPLVVFNFTIKNNIYGTWAARLVGVYAINNVSGLGTAFINKGITSVVVRWLYKLSQPSAYKVFCQNEEDYQLLIANRLVPAHKLDLLPGSGVDINRFSPGLLDNNNNKFVFLYVGRMLSDKGLNELIQAAEKLYQKRQDFIVQLCGFAGVKNNSAIAQATLDIWSQLPYIDYLGSSDCIEKVYAKANCVVLPSYREGMPRSLLEAGAMGLPSITTDVPGCRNIIINNINGLLCDVKSSSSLFSAMLNLLDLPDDVFDSLCLNARSKVVNEFDEKIVINKALSVVKELS